ncbi:hypothetical protein Taro_005664 [Colocasia esculenta]|uniref:Pentatricopeptide repeat-containing protein n=1 Tax=Colocasia esculenta TaxID=4460 RepID=A0A843TV64_COLES|nr:hypothetical protein [Colocasia esculenta]
MPIAKTTPLSRLPLRPRRLHLATPSLSRHQPAPSPPAAAAASPSGPVDTSALLRLCTVLYQQQHSPDARFHARLRALDLPLSHELFLQVCNRFPRSWRPVLRLFRYGELCCSFSPTPVAVNKMVDVFGKARNIELLWDFLREASSRPGVLVNTRTLLLAARAFAEARQMKKCVGLFHLLGSREESLCSVGALNAVVAELCSHRLVDEAKDVVTKLKGSIAPDGTTYSLLVVSLCRSGDLVRASKMWNAMVDAGLEPEVGAYDEMITTFFKNNRGAEAMTIFRCMRSERMCDLELPTYRIVITWMCKGGGVEQALMLRAEMVKRGIGVDGPTLGALVYGFLCRKRVKEGYRVLEGMEIEPDISVFHGLIKGFLRLRRASEATHMFREMTQRGIAPTMHTYIMLLQGHLGKRGRKARDPEVNFESVFVGGLIKMGRMLDATKYVERTMWGGVEVPRFDYNKFLRDFSNEEGVVMFEQVGKRLGEAGLVDLGDIFLSYGEKMATRERRRRTQHLIKCV